MTCIGLYPNMIEVNLIGSQELRPPPIGQWDKGHDNADDDELTWTWYVSF